MWRQKGPTSWSLACKYATKQLSQLWMCLSMCFRFARCLVCLDDLNETRTCGLGLCQHCASELFEGERIRESCFLPCSGHIDVYNRILKPEPIQKTSFLSFRSPCLGAILIISRVGYVIPDFWNQYISRLNFYKAWPCKGFFARAKYC